MVEIELKSAPNKPLWLQSAEENENLGRYHFRVATQSHKWRPPTDVFETDEAIIVRVEIAGMRDSDFSISLNNRTLTIQGVRPDSDQRLTFHQMEVRFGEFQSNIDLSSPVDSQKVEAEYKDGFLRLVLPKLKPHHIQIEK